MRDDVAPRGVTYHNCGVPGPVPGYLAFRRYVLLDPMQTETIVEFDKSVEGWTDQRLLSREDLKTLTMFTMYLVNLAEHDGWVYRGHSWKESSHLGCLVVKAIVDGVPSVVFTNAKTLVCGMRIFLRKLEGEFLEWVPDRFA